MQNKRGNVLATVLLSILVIVTTVVLTYQFTDIKINADPHKIVSESDISIRLSLITALNKFVTSSYSNLSRACWYCNYPYPPGINESTKAFNNYLHEEVLKSLSKLKSQLQGYNYTLEDNFYVESQKINLSDIPDAVRVEIKNLSVKLEYDGVTQKKNLSNKYYFDYKVWNIYKNMYDWLLNNPEVIPSQLYQELFDIKNHPCQAVTCACGDVSGRLISSSDLNKMKITEDDVLESLRKITDEINSAFTDENIKCEFKINRDKLDIDNNVAIDQKTSDACNKVMETEFYDEWTPSNPEKKYSKWSKHKLEKCPTDRDTISVPINVKRSDNHFIDYHFSEDEPLNSLNENMVSSSKVELVGVSRAAYGEFLIECTDYGSNIETEKGFVPFAIDFSFAYSVVRNCDPPPFNPSDYTLIECSTYEEEVGSPPVNDQTDIGNDQGEDSDVDNDVGGGSGDGSGGIGGPSNPPSTGTQLCNLGDYDINEVCADELSMGADLECIEMYCIDESHVGCRSQFPHFSQQRINNECNLEEGGEYDPKTDIYYQCITAECVNNKITCKQQNNGHLIVGSQSELDQLKKSICPNTYYSECSELTCKDKKAECRITNVNERISDQDVPSKSLSCPLSNPSCVELVCNSGGGISCQNAPFSIYPNENEELVKNVCSFQEGDVFNFRGFYLDCVYAKCFGDQLECDTGNNGGSLNEQSPDLKSTYCPGSYYDECDELICDEGGSGGVSCIIDNSQEDLKINDQTSYTKESYCPETYDPECDELICSGGEIGCDIDNNLVNQEIGDQSQDKKDEICPASSNECVELYCNTTGQVDCREVQFTSHGDVVKDVCGGFDDNQDINNDGLFIDCLKAECIDDSLECRPDNEGVAINGDNLFGQCPASFSEDCVSFECKDGKVGCTASNQGALVEDQSDETKDALCSEYNNECVDVVCDINGGLTCKYSDHSDDEDLVRSVCGFEDGETVNSLGYHIDCVDVECKNGLLQCVTANQDLPINNYDDDLFNEVCGDSEYDYCKEMVCHDKKPVCHNVDYTETHHLDDWIVKDVCDISDIDIFNETSGFHIDCVDAVCQDGELMCVGKNDAQAVTTDPKGEVYDFFCGDVPYDECKTIVCNDRKVECVDDNYKEDEDAFRDVCNLPENTIFNGEYYIDCVKAQCTDGNLECVPVNENDPIIKKTGFDENQWLSVKNTICDSEEGECLKMYCQNGGADCRSNPDAELDSSYFDAACTKFTDEWDLKEDMSYGKCYKPVCKDGSYACIPTDWNINPWDYTTDSFKQACNLDDDLFDNQNRYGGCMDVVCQNGKLECKVNSLDNIFLPDDSGQINVGMTQENGEMETVELTEDFRKMVCGPYSDSICGDVQCSINGELSCDELEFSGDPDDYVRDVCNIKDPNIYNESTGYFYDCVTVACNQNKLVCESYRNNQNIETFPWRDVTEPLKNEVCGTESGTCMSIFCDDKGVECLDKPKTDLSDSYFKTVCGDFFDESKQVFSSPYDERATLLDDGRYGYCYEPVCNNGGYYCEPQTLESTDLDTNMYTSEIKKEVCGLNDDLINSNGQFGGCLNLRCQSGRLVCDEPSVGEIFGSNDLSTYDMGLINFDSKQKDLVSMDENLKFSVCGGDSNLECGNLKCLGDGSLECNTETKINHDCYIDDPLNAQCNYCNENAECIPKDDKSVCSIAGMNSHCTVCEQGKCVPRTDNYICNDNYGCETQCDSNGLCADITSSGDQGKYCTKGTTDDCQEYVCKKEDEYNYLVCGKNFLYDDSYQQCCGEPGPDAEVCPDTWTCCNGPSPDPNHPLHSICQASPDCGMG